jgi:hypothetical protein
MAVTGTALAAPKGRKYRVLLAAGSIGGTCAMKQISFSSAGGGCQHDAMGNLA